MARRRGKTPKEDGRRKAQPGKLPEEQERPAKRVRIVKQGKPHVIDLLDEVDF